MGEAGYQGPLDKSRSEFSEPRQEHPSITRYEGCGTNWCSQRQCSFNEHSHKVGFRCPILFLSESCELIAHAAAAHIWWIGNNSGIATGEVFSLGDNSPRPIEGAGLEQILTVERFQVSCEQNRQIRVGSDQGAKGVCLRKLIPEDSLLVAITI